MFHIFLLFPSAVAWIFRRNRRMLSAIARSIRSRAGSLNSKMSVPSPRKKKFGRLYFLINSLRVIVSWPLRCRCVWFRYCLYSRDPAKFPCQIVLPGVSQEFSENFFALICTFFGTGDGGEWLQKRGSGRVKPNLFIARGQSAFQSGQTDYLSPFFTQTTSQFSQDTPSSTSFFAKFIAYVTSG